MSVEYETFKDGGVKYFLMKLASKVSGLFVAKTGDTMSGNLETSADLKFTVKSKGLYGIDHGNNSYPMMRDNGTNLWIGATQTSAQHHIGGVYVSSGYDQTNSRGYETIYVSVPNATNTGATNRKVWHNGNLTKLSQLTNDGDGTQGSTFALAADLPGQATDSNLGLVKLNPNESVDVNANGQITVGGRLGQYPNGGGLYYPTNIQPENVAANCLLLTEATTVGLTANRTFALAGGANVTLKSSAAAGSTTYYVNNTFANRFTCAMAYGGYAAIDQSGAGTLCVKVTAVYYENDTTKARLVPHSGATESNNRIVIETETSVNPDAATTKLRLYGSMKYDSSVHIGQGIGTGGVSGKGKLLQVGQSQTALDPGGAWNATPRSLPSLERKIRSRTHA